MKRGLAAVLLVLAAPAALMACGQSSEAVRTTTETVGATVTEAPPATASLLELREEWLADFETVVDLVDEQVAVIQSTSADEIMAGDQQFLAAWGALTGCRRGLDALPEPPTPETRELAAIYSQACDYLIEAADATAAVYSSGEFDPSAVQDAMAPLRKAVPLMQETYERLAALR